MRENRSQAENRSLTEIAAVREIPLNRSLTAHCVSPLHRFKYNLGQMQKLSGTLGKAEVLSRHSTSNNR